ncbi:MAG: adenylate kinase [Candidatus Marinimicrobia bacterium]|nr:adenylate kinase [Candidatus Neomarinimicrobiota bacterium]
MDAIILLGAPGAGKGTVAGAVERETGYAHVSTGDLLRAALKAGTPVGLQAKAYMDAGELVPDDVILGIVRERLETAGPDGRVLFDGFPRTTVQAEQLAAVLAEQGGQVSHVFLLDVPEAVLIDRLAGRRVCRACGAVYHVRNIPPRVAGICDRCGGELFQRPDDTEETVRNRLVVYEQQTASLIEFYDARGLLVRIPAAGERSATEAAIVAQVTAG